MRFYKQRHKFYCGIDLHARKMYVCILDADGKSRVHQNIDTDPQLFYDLIFPFLKYDIVVGVECMFSWYWVADLCAEHKIPFALGHALYMRAIHGSKTKDDKKDSYKIAALLKGGNFPIAYPYPAKMRATRDLLRRRTFFVRQCGELVAHIQNTNTQYNLPAFNKKISRKCNREGVVDRFEQGAVKASVAADLAMIDTYNTVISKLEWQIDKAARQHDHFTFSLLQTIPGVGQILALTILYEICTIKRFPSSQDFCSYCRLIKPDKESAGKRTGKGNGKIGNAHLKWAIREAASLMIRDQDQVKKYMEKMTKKHGSGKAMGLLGHKLGRAIFYMLKNREPFRMDKFFAH